VDGRKVKGSPKKKMDFVIRGKRRLTLSTISAITDKPQGYRVDRRNREEKRWVERPYNVRRFPDKVKSNCLGPGKGGIAVSLDDMGGRTRRARSSGEVLGGPGQVWVSF